MSGVFGGGGAAGVNVVSYTSVSTGTGTQGVFATSGLPYRALAKATPEEHEIYEVIAGATGTLAFDLKYAPSSDHGGDYAIQIDYIRIADGEDPNKAWTTQASFTFTPGSGTSMKTLLGSSQATMQIAVVEGERIRIRVTRKNIAGDTHGGGTPSSLMLCGCRWRVS
jgi:FtsP/CotA-like multicopper oxidase with cupredoxin domain